MREVEFKLKKGQVQTFRVDILKHGLCELFLPLNIIREGDDNIYVIQTEGFKSLSLINEIRASDALSAVVSLISGIISAENNCFFIGDYLINPELLFIRLNNLEVRLAYYPKNGDQCSGSEISIKENLMDVVEALGMHVRQESRSYLINAFNFIRDHNCEIEVIRHRLSKLREEAFRCGY